MDGQTDRRTMDRLWYEFNIPFFSKEKKAGITSLLFVTPASSGEILWSVLIIRNWFGLRSLSCFFVPDNCIIDPRIFTIHVLTDQLG